MEGNQKSGKGHQTFIKVFGIPLPPPRLTEKEKIACRLWKTEAIIIEKELKLKRKVKQLMTLESILRRASSRPVSSRDSGIASMPVLDVLRKAIDEEKNKDFVSLAEDITRELRGLMSDADYPEKNEAFSKLLSRLKNELEKRQSTLNSASTHSEQPKSIMKHSDSTYNDVAHITLNDRPDSASSCSTVKEIPHFPLDKRSDTSSSRHSDISLPSESIFKQLDECTPDDECITMVDSLPVDDSRRSSYTPSPSLTRNISKITITSTPKADKDERSNQSGGENPSTPTQLIRRNSYTLDSPSPSVLTYLRNLSKENNSKSESSDERCVSNSSPRSVVRNLNDLWMKEEKKNRINDISPDCRDSLEDGDNDSLLEEDEKENAVLDSYHEHKLAQSRHEEESVKKCRTQLLSVSFNEQDLKPTIGSQNLSHSFHGQVCDSRSSLNISPRNSIESIRSLQLSQINQDKELRQTLNRCFCGQKLNHGDISGVLDKCFHHTNSTNNNYERNMTESFHTRELEQTTHEKSLDDSYLHTSLDLCNNEQGEKLTPHETDEMLAQKLKAALIIQSYARGFFVRRLMRTKKVEEIKNTIKDAVVCAWGLYSEQAVTPADLHLHERIIQQVTAACYELHSIFFKWSTSEKMALIRSDRERLKNPKPKAKFRASRQMRRSESDSLSASSSRSTSRTRTPVTQSHKRTKSNDIGIKRPSTLPSIPKSTTMNYRPWR